jgi:sulfur carrier protein ThiS
MRLHLGGQFSFYILGHPRWVEVELKEPARLSEVLTGLGIPVAEINLATVNGDLVEVPEALVTQKDVVKIYPPVGGGS